MKKTGRAQNSKSQKTDAHEGNLIEMGHATSAELEREPSYDYKKVTPQELLNQTVSRLEKIATKTRCSSIEDLMSKAESSDTYNELFQEALALNSRLGFLKRA